MFYCIFYPLYHFFTSYAISGAIHGHVRHTQVCGKFSNVNPSGYINYVLHPTFFVNCVSFTVCLQLQT